ncbi:hypothetical protein CNMCM6069_003174 [Aspergillus lentulus]|nr:hypothetical protein CNMCM6069_003174 [Aspergillus lentulus]KAF4171296.1 hypothetical protein CNMCM8060_003129 [Aspergillus lentulus]KAF4193640.1 hypothetical protein CNMCM8694_008520 [Aspergillus lentulus]
MSGVEILGAIAAAAQLAELAINIVSKIEKVRHVRQEYGKFSLQVNHLFATAQLIRNCPALQTDEVRIHLSDTVSEAEALLSVLNTATQQFAVKSFARKYWGVIKRQDQRVILFHFENLQKHKTALILCISAINSTQLSTLQEGIEKLATAVDSASPAQNPRSESPTKPASMRSPSESRKQDHGQTPLGGESSTARERLAIVPSNGGASPGSQSHERIFQGQAAPTQSIGPNQG